MPETVPAQTRDSLGWRKLFAVVAPSTNTSVQPEYDSMRPRGVTNHFARISIPDTRVTDDASFMAMLENIRAATMEAVDVAMSMEPDDLIMGMSAETFWDGAEGAERMHRGLSDRTGRKVVMGSEAVNEALKAYGIAPPVGASKSKLALFGAAPAVACPQCGASDTEKISEFGSTACKASYKCTECLEPFEYFKCI